MSGHGSRDPEALSDHDLCGWRPANHSHWLAARLSDPQTWYRLSVQQREVCCIMSCLERFDHDIPVSSNLPHRLRTQPCSHKLDTIYPVRSIIVNGSNIDVIWMLMNIFLLYYRVYIMKRRTGMVCVHHSCSTICPFPSQVRRFNTGLPCFGTFELLLSVSPVPSEIQ